MTDQGGFQGIVHGLFAKWLAQESDCSCGQHLCTRRLIGVPCNEDYWHRETISAQTSIKLHASQTRQVHIGDRQDLSLM